MLAQLMRAGDMCRGSVWRQQLKQVQNCILTMLLLPAGLDGVMGTYFMGTYCRAYNWQDSCFMLVQRNAYLHIRSRRHLAAALEVAVGCACMGTGHRYTLLVYNE
jgi:hypothetical protein